MSQNKCMNEMYHKMSSLCLLFGRRKSVFFYLAMLTFKYGKHPNLFKSKILEEGTNSQNWVVHGQYFVPCLLAEWMHFYPILITC